MLIIPVINPNTKSNLTVSRRILTPSPSPYSLLYPAKSPSLYSPCSQSVYHHQDPHHRLVSWSHHQTLLQSRHPAVHYWCQYHVHRKKVEMASTYIISFLKIRCSPTTHFLRCLTQIHRFMERNRMFARIIPAVTNEITISPTPFDMTTGLERTFS